jgi:hypothetical protein
MCHCVLAAPRSKHQLEQHALLQLLHGVDDGAALVPANRPRSEDPSGRKHVDSERNFADASFPNGSALLFLLLLSSHKRSL